jgi:hypothetical protein
MGPDGGGGGGGPEGGAFKAGAPGYARGGGRLGHLRHGDAKDRDDVFDAHVRATSGEVALMRFHDGVPHIKQITDVGRGEPPVAHDLGGDVGLEGASEARFQLGPHLFGCAGDDELGIGLAHRRVARFERGIEAIGLFLLKSVES